MTMTDDVYKGTGAVPRAGKMVISYAKLVPRRIVRLGLPSTYSDEVVIPTPVPGVLSQLPIELSLSCYAGDDFAFALIVNDLDGSPPELDSLQILAQIRANVNSPVVGVMAATIKRNVITLRLTGVKTQNLVGSYVWDVQAKDYFGLVQTFAFGTFTVTRDVSRALPSGGGGGDGGPGPGPGPGPEPGEPPAPLWENSHHYLPGDLVSEAIMQDGVQVYVTWINLVDHNSLGAPATFAMERQLYPDYWTTGEDVTPPIEEMIQPWTNSTQYAVGVIVGVISTGITGIPIGQTEYWACAIAHTSPAPPTTFYEQLIVGGLKWTGPLSTSTETDPVGGGGPPLFPTGLRRMRRK